MIKASWEVLPDGSQLVIPGFCGILAQRYFADGTVLSVEEMIFTRQICLRMPQTNPMCCDDLWCFEKTLDIIEILKNWNYPEDKEPMGWHRHPPSDRRRVKGDPNMEYIGMRPPEWVDL